MTEEQCKTICKMYIDDRYMLLNYEQRHWLKWIVDQARTPVQLIGVFVMTEGLYGKLLQRKKL